MAVCAVSPELPANTPTALDAIACVNHAPVVQLAPSSEYDTVHSLPARLTLRYIGGVTDNPRNACVLAVSPEMVATKSFR